MAEKVNQTNAKEMEPPGTVRRVPTQVTEQALLSDQTAYVSSVTNTVSRKKIRFENYVGKWVAFLPMDDLDESGITTLDNAWFKVLNAYEKNKSIFLTIMVTTAIKQSDCIVPPNVRAQKRGVLMCFTNDFRDTFAVKRAGAIFRELLKEEMKGSYIFYMRGFTEYCGKNGCMRQCSPEYSFYVQNPDGSFLKKVKVNPKAPEITEGGCKLIPSKVKHVEWITGHTAYSKIEEIGFDKETAVSISSLEKYTLQDASPQVRSDQQTSFLEFISSENPLPEIVLKPECGRTFALESLNESKLYSTIGKWMAFLRNDDADFSGLTTLDKAWFKLLDAWEKDYEIFDNIKVSTSMELEQCTSPFNDSDKCGVIVILTSDYRNLKDGRRAATVFRHILEEELHNINLLYKTDNSTSAFQYQCLGDGGVSLYRHSPDGSFWKRIEGKRWERLVMGKMIIQNRIPSQDKHDVFITQDSALTSVEEEFVYNRSYENESEDGVLQRWVESRYSSKNQSTEESVGNYLIENRFSGYWKAYLSLNKKDEHGLAHLDQGWYKVLEHQGRDPTKFSSILVSTKRLVIRYEEELFGIVCCSTKDYRDMPDVRRVAGHLRDVLGDLVVNDKLYYHARGYHMYKHDPDWSFWKQMDNESWQRMYVEGHY